MSSFAEQLRLAEKAAENIYFARLSRELIEALHQLPQAQKSSCQAADPAPEQGRRKANMP